MSEILTTDDRKEKVALLRLHHQPVFEALNISSATFIPKMAHFVSGLRGKHMGFFESELSHGNDVYTEMINRSWDSEDSTRTLYKYRSNPHFRDELATSDPDKNGNVRYFVPMDELEIVEAPIHKPKRKKKVGKIQTRKPDTNINVSESGDESEDFPMNEMTCKDYIAVHTGMPVSEKQWINDIVTGNNNMKI